MRKKRKSKEDLNQIESILAMRLTPWLKKIRYDHSSDILTLFCFPYAGVAASYFKKWSEYLPKEIRLVAVQLPGREERFNEPLFYSLEKLVEALWGEIHSHLNNPYVFYGHSLGARIAYEVTKLVHKEDKLLPKCLIVSGARAPQFKARSPKCTLSDNEFIEAMRESNATSGKILENVELMEALLPYIRADYAVADTAPIDLEEKPLVCPVIAYGGICDTEIDAEKVAGWASKTSGEFSIRMFDGDHFFIDSLREDVLSKLILDIMRY